MASLCCTALLCLILLLLLHLRICFTSPIKLGSELSARENEAWLSENRTFAFGFTRYDDTDQLLLAIWYAALLSDPTVVWSPNRESPVGRDAVVKLDIAGELVLTDGNMSVWTSNTSGQGVQFGIISDSGSLVLYNGSSSDRQVAWQSFWHPSDTLLPGQPLSIDIELSSSKSLLGYYSLKMLQQRTSLSLALTYISPDASSSSPEFNANYSYWSSAEVSNATGDVEALLDQSGNFGIVYGASSSGAVFVHKNDTGGDYLRRIKIETDGNLRLYRWGNGGWVTEWSAVLNPCIPAGVCGNGVCNLGASKTNASCTCLPGTSSVNARTRGCKSSSEMSSMANCDGKQSGNLRMETMSQTNYYFTGESTIKNHSSVSTGSDCANYCLSDCNCVAAVYGLSSEKSYCWTLKKLVFGGFQDPSSTLLVKVTNDSSGMANGSSSETPSADRDRVVVLPLVLCISVLALLLSLLLCYSIRKRKMMRRKMTCRSLSFTGAPVFFSYHDLQIATRNFSTLIGTGGFGSVYKGTLKDGTLVAVKKLERILPQGEKEFITEVTTIGSMHHMNLVSLSGFCSEGSHRLLVYEYMSNGSLDKWIFPSKDLPKKLLDWKTRFGIAISVAQGIAYFHEQCRNRIIHCDIKPENILLDDNFHPKVSDFGLAKLMSREHSQVITMVRGTRGYLAPEWVSNRPITVKADVYSFGMLLLETIGGRRNLDVSLGEVEFYYPECAFKALVDGNPAKAADRRLDGDMEEEKVERGLKVAFWCIQEEAWSRPSMGEVVKMLEGSVEIETPPMPQAVLELMEEGLHSVYKAMRRDYFNHSTGSSAVTSRPSSRATCSYSTMSPR